MKKIIVTLSVLVSTLFQVYAAKKIDSGMYVIDPYYYNKLSGPILNQTSIQDYRSEVFRLIIKNAHKRAKKYQKIGDYKAYWSFMVLALAVPIQESNAIHFRQTPYAPDICGYIRLRENPRKNTRLYSINGVPLKKSEIHAVNGFFGDSNAGDMIPGSWINGKFVSTSLKHFRKYLKSGDHPYVANCSEIRDTDILRQMRRGSNGTDIGIMQLNMRWFYKVYLAEKRYLSVDKSIYFGQNLLRRGFYKIYRNKNKYKCLFNNGRFNYKSLIRGIWGGKYNTGNTKVKSVCRFADKNSPHHESHDQVFYRNLTDILNGTQKTYAGMNQTEKEAYLDIINNYHTGANRKKKVGKFIKF